MALFGKHLRELRERAGIRIKDLAQAMNWTTVYISDIELGRRNPPSPAKIRQIASVLRVDPTELLDLANKERKKVVLDLDEESPNRMNLALMLARSWEGLPDDVANELNEILSRRTKGPDGKR
ncbi:MAG: helix-turn-helix domain-containing protein [Deltaproteobacteria bacterium]|nr:helix-turn-helix domain-containing protein [Deltaproteobacteria bacterium]